VWTSRTTETATRLRRLAALLMFEAKARAFGRELKAGFRPDQPRVPAGNPGTGGRWVDEGGSKPILVSRRRGGGGQIRINGRLVPITPAQQTRLEVTGRAMRDSIAEAKRLDRTWRPRPQMFESVEEMIQANESSRYEAELRIFALTGRVPRPGPFANKWIASPPPGSPLTAEQRRQLDLIGRLFGCHGCGSVSKLTRNGHSIGDHHIPRSLGVPDRIFPHCTFCSSSQGGLISNFLRGFDYGN
jgi:hypothetical protein